jgi:hypothetical protein
MVLILPQFKLQHSYTPPPLEFTTLQLGCLIFCALLIGVAKSGFAGGIGILVTPLLALVMDASMALGLLLTLLFSADIFNFYHYWKQWERSSLVMVVPGSVLGVICGWPLLHHLKGGGGDTDYLAKAIGVTALVFGLVTLYKDVKGKLDLPFRPNAGHGMLAGITAGTISTIAHQGGLITQMYLLPQRLSPQAFVASTTVIYFTINLSKFPIYLAEGVLDLKRTIYSAAFIPLVFGGSLLGKYLNTKLSPKFFTKIILAFVLFTAAKLLWD